MRCLNCCALGCPVCLTCSLFQCVYIACLLRSRDCCGHVLAAVLCLLRSLTLISTLYCSALDGVQTAELRTELLVQLMKQLTAAATGDKLRSAGEAKGWDLLALCLHNFPPPPDFEDFLTVFIESAPAPAGETDRAER